MDTIHETNTTIKRLGLEGPSQNPVSVTGPVTSNIASNVAVNTAANVAATTAAPVAATATSVSVASVVAVSVSVVAVIAVVVVVVSVTVANHNKDNDKDKNINVTPVEKTDAWSIAYEKATKFISNLTIEEKTNLLYGTENCHFVTEEEKASKCVGQLDVNENISFPGMCLQDGPAGLRQMNGTSISWHAAINTAATFNKKLMYQIGKAQGEESKLKGVNTLLSPGVNIMRTPQAGRLWEGFGEDPFYSGVCAKQVVQGIQDAGVIATIKHFTGNDQETYRKNSTSNIDTQALFDVYIEPFYRSIKESNVASFMCAYNAVNKVKTCKNEYLLTTVLRDMLDFKGFVMSDWWAVTSNDIDDYVNAGLEVNMPGGYKWGTEYYGRNGSYWQNFTQEVEEGSITEDRLDEAVTRVIASMYYLDQMEGFPEKDLTKNVITDERVSIQRQAATESQVLLKNDGILPINASAVKTIAVVGNAAFPRDCINGDGDHQCYNSTNHVSNGHIPIGYGSGTTDFPYLISPIEAITKLAEKKGINVTSFGDMIYTNGTGELENTSVSAVEDIDAAVSVANNTDLVIVYVCADSGEGYLALENSKGDRGDLEAWHNGTGLVNAILEVNENVIVVINAPAVIDVPWLDKVKAVVFSGFGGMESGNGIADILFGEKYPSGHLPYVWGNMNDYPVQITQLVDGDDPLDTLETYNYDEGLYVGQRWFNKKNLKATFPFGYGLTYTKFNYSDLSLSMNETGLLATFNVENVGSYSGSAVPMMFLTFPSDIGDYPEYIFKGFEKVEISVGETKTVEILADEHALSYFNVDKNKYVRVDSGNIKVYIAENGDKNSYKLYDEISAEY